MAISCDYCLNTINGKYLIIDNKSRACQTCYSRFIQCERCGRHLPGKRAIPHRNKFYCSDCRNSLLLCSHCGKVITGEYFSFEKHILCSSCNNLQKCQVCSLPYKKNRPIIQLYDDHFICEDCRENAVLGSDTLKEIFKVALVMLNRLFNIKIQKLNNVKLVTKSEILREGRKSASKSKGSSMNIKGVASNNGDIIILTGESKSMALSIIVHELGHIWQFENWIDYSSKTSIEKEGFCEWLAYNILQELQLHAAAERMLNNEIEIYNRGLQLYLKKEKIKSIQELVSGN